MALFKEARVTSDPETHGLLDERPCPASEVVEGPGTGRKKLSAEFRVLWTSIFLNVVLIGCIVFLIISSRQGYCSTSPARSVYSPADEAAEFETVVFRTGLKNDRSPYIGLEDAVDEAWEDLYNDFGMSLIDKHSAERIPNRTAPAPFDSSKYVVQIDVFHQVRSLVLYS